VQELDLDLAPGGLLHRPIGQPLPVNRVVRDGRERIAVAVQQASFDAGGVTFLAPLIASASARTDSASGITRGLLGRVRMSGAA